MIDLIHGDCNDILPSIDSHSVDLCPTDPPYNISRENQYHTMGRAGIDFGDWDKNADILGYIKEISRILNKNGSFIVFNAWKNLGDISKEACLHGFEPKEMLRLEKINPVPRNIDRRYVIDYECAIWFVKTGSKWTFNRTDKKYNRPKFVHPLENGLHPTQKNENLMKEILMIHSNEGDVVMDPFMGSGTTGSACHDLGRSFIGIELDKKYFDIASDRIQKKQSQFSLMDIEL